MQTETLHEFVVLANYLNFRRAADLLHISQPTLSNHITALERELGFRLFDREGGTRLTTAGAHFYDAAQALLDGLERGIEESRALAREHPPVRIQSYGKEDSVLSPLFSQLETPFRLVPLDETSPALASLETGEADIVVTPHAPALIERGAPTRKTRLACLPIGEVGLTLLMSRANPLAALPALTREDLRGAEVFIPYGNSYDWGKSFAADALGSDLGLTFVKDPGLPLGLDNIPLRGLGQRVTMSYRGAARRACAYQPDLVAFDELDGAPWTTTEYLVFRADDPNPNVPAFVEEVRALTQAQ